MYGLFSILQQKSAVQKISYTSVPYHIAISEMHFILGDGLADIW